VSNPVNFISGRLIKRYKRFFADVKLDSGEVVTAHCPNTGSMMGLLTEGNIVYLIQNRIMKKGSSNTHLK
jgi:sugar fermentation stimulation protein A